MYRRKKIGNFLAVALAISFAGSYFTTASDETDRNDCKNVQCQPIQCPDDSESVYVQQQTRDNINYDYDGINNFSDTLEDGGRPDDGETTQPDHQIRRHIDNFYVEPSEKANGTETNRTIAKRSLQYKRRESIKIVPGDYISLVPDLGHYHNSEQINHGKWKREDSQPAVEAKVESESNTTINSSQCCPAQQCVCKLNCDIQVCPRDTDVLLEIRPGHQDTPGECCPLHKCAPEPDCKDITSRVSWTDSCRTCRCLAGNKLCHNTCGDEDDTPKTCLSLTIRNKLYLDGETWLEDECTHCECVAGERKCVTSFCRALECRNKIKIPGECCPVCEPNVTSTESGVTEKDPLSDGTIMTTTTKAFTSESTGAVVSVNSPATILSVSASTSTEADISVTETAGTRNDERQIPPIAEADNEKVDYEMIILYIAIPVLSFLCLLFAFLWWRLKNKKKSYGPVPSFDSNLNRVSSPITTA